MVDSTKDLRAHIDDVMQGWGKWSASHGVNLDYPNITPFRRLLGSSLGAMPMSDEVAEEVDRALSALKNENPTARKVAVLYYVHGIALDKMKDYGIGRDRARIEKAFLEGWLGQKLFNLL